MKRVCISPEKQKWVRKLLEKEIEDCAKLFDEVARNLIVGDWERYRKKLQMAQALRAELHGKRNVLEILGFDELMDGISRKISNIATTVLEKNELTKLSEIIKPKTVLQLLEIDDPNEFAKYTNLIARVGILLPDLKT